LEEGKILAEVLPCGAGASRLVTGIWPFMKNWKNYWPNGKETEKALVFASGYQTNTGVIAALVGKGDVIFAEKLNHAS
jgi:8-amino-7-oxononanoate synthase